jgi:Ser/Thr protein kinase RdoA (MazF antagonist)
MSETELPFVLTDWCRTVLGKFTVLSTKSQEHSESAVWQLATEQEIIYLKAYQRLAKWGMEVHAYENWVSALEGQSPRSLAVLEEPIPAILLTELTGVTMDRLTLATEQEQAVWQAAGATLARLHALPSGQWFGIPSRDGSPLSEFPETKPVLLMRTSLEYWFFRGLHTQILTPKEIKTVERALERVDIFADERSIACHGDYQPRNWIVGMDGIWCGVIDFEHARWDLKMSDLGYWWDRGPRERPDLKGAFLQGYGELNERESEQLNVIRILGATGRIIWGREYGDDSTEQLGHEVLEQLAETTVCL